MPARGHVSSLVLALALPTVAAAALAAPASAAGAPTCQGARATIVGTRGADRLVGTPRRDVIVGLGGNDRIRGLGGDDVLCGGRGSDRLEGGPGADQLFGGHDQHRRHADGSVDIRGDVLDGGAGDDLLRPGLDRANLFEVDRPNMVTYAHAPRGVEVNLPARLAFGQGRDRLVAGDGLVVVGSAYDDTLTGTAFDEGLLGGRGDDVLSGGAGRDVLMGGAGDDTQAAGGGGDFVVAERGADELSGGAGKDLLLAFGPRVASVSGDGGADQVLAQFGQASAGTIDGGAGDNSLLLASALDEPTPTPTPGPAPKIAVDRGAGTVVAQAGTRTVTLGVTGFGTYALLGRGVWSYQGTDAADSVQVLGGRLLASTLGGDDFLAGDQRNDVLDGGADTDTAFGGAGTNTCVAVEKGSCDGYAPGEDGSGPLVVGRTVALLGAHGSAVPPMLRPLVERYAPSLR